MKRRGETGCTGRGPAREGLTPVSPDGGKRPARRKGPRRPGKTPDTGVHGERTLIYPRLTRKLPTERKPKVANVTNVTNGANAANAATGGRNRERRHL